MFILPVFITAIIAGFVHMGAKSYWSGSLRSAKICTVLYCLLVFPAIFKSLIDLSIWAILIPVIAFCATTSISMTFGIPFLREYSRRNNSANNETVARQVRHTVLPKTIFEWLIITTVFGFVLGVAMTSGTPFYIAIPGLLLIPFFIWLIAPQESK